MTPARRLVAEGLGTAFLLAAVVGSGIMGERLSAGNSAIALLANTLATGAALVVLILTFGPVSGAHFNPAVSLAEFERGKLSRRELSGYIGAQLAGAIAGVAATHLMFSEPLFAVAKQAHSGPAQWWSEFVATFGLIVVIQNVSRTRPQQISVAVGGYITAAYWFTASTAFANPAVTVARTLTNGFAGIRPLDALAFVPAQLLGAGAAILLLRWLYARSAVTTGPSECFRNPMERAGSPQQL